MTKNLFNLKEKALVSRNQSPVKIIVADSLYEILAERRADRNAKLAADGLPPAEDDFPFITKEQAEAQAQAEANQRTAQNAASLAPPPPTRGPLCRAAKTKVAERNAAIPGFDRHSRKCQICRSPYVDYIEQVYLQWEEVDLICRYFQLVDPDTVYRHARAAGLDVLRRQNPRWVLEQFIEQWRTVKITSSTVIRSIRALSCLDEKGRWTDLPKTHILVRGADSSAPLRSPDLQEDGDLPPSSDNSRRDDESLSFERSSQPRGDAPLSAERSSRAQVGAPSSFESDLRGQMGVLSSFERSEPPCGRDSGLPGKAVTSSTGEPIPAITASDTGIPQGGSDEVSFSYEREPHCGRDSGLPLVPSTDRSSRPRNDVPFSFERSEPFAEGES